MSGSSEERKRGPPPDETVKKLSAQLEVVKSRKTKYAKMAEEAADNERALIAQRDQYEKERLANVPVYTEAQFQAAVRKAVAKALYDEYTRLYNAHTTAELRHIVAVKTAQRDHDIMAYLECKEQHDAAVTQLKKAKDAESIAALNVRIMQLKPELVALSKKKGGTASSATKYTKFLDVAIIAGIE